MDFSDYQIQAIKTAIYPADSMVTYPALGLAGEAGEVCNKIKKVIRDGTEINKEELIGELGDVLWYLAALARDLDISLQVVAEQNIKKLQDRQQRGKLQGNGDNR